MNAVKTIQWAFAILAMPAFANAASASRNCFETEQQAEKFVENLESTEKAFHASEKQFRQLMQSPGLKYNMLTFIVGGEIEFHDIDPKPALAASHHTTLSHRSHHYHLTAMAISEDPSGKFCNLVGSEAHTYGYNWFLDADRNVLNSKFTTEKSW